MGNPMIPLLAPQDEPTPRLLLLKSEYERRKGQEDLADSLELLRSLRSQSRHILTEAEGQAEDIREQARKEGRAEGEQAAVHAALDTLRLRKSLIDSLVGEIQEIIAFLARQLGDGESAESVEGTFVEKFKAALNSVRSEPILRLFCSPERLPYLEGSLQAVQQELGYLGKIEFAADETLSPESFRLQGNGCSLLSSRAHVLDSILNRLVENPRIAQTIRQRLEHGMNKSSDAGLAILDVYQTELERLPAFETRGSVLKLDQSVLQLALPAAELEQRVSVERSDPASPPLLAQVVALDRHYCLASPLGSVQGISCGAKVVPSFREASFAVGSHLLGCVLGSQGEIQERLEGAVCGVDWALAQGEYRPLQSRPPLALERQPVEKIFRTGLRAIDAFTTLGCGQRIGIFAEPGVGKSTLLGNLVQTSAADIVVVGLVGERGREVREFLDQNLNPESRRKAVVVYSTSDEPALSRINASLVAMTVAEYFRDQGKDVLLLLDSLTRLCRAYREIGLVAGESAVRKGYPASVFARLPEFIERAGCGLRGSITGMYTILLSGDLDEDPMVEEIKSLTDGHLVLRRELAERGQYPAIDVIRSVSRLAHQLTDEKLQHAGMHGRRLLSRLEKDRELLLFGGSPDTELAEAIRMEARILEFLKQGRGEWTEFGESRERLIALFSEQAEVSAVAGGFEGDSSPGSPSDRAPGGWKS